MMTLKTGQYHHNCWLSSGRMCGGGDRVAG